MTAKTANGQQVFSHRREWMEIGIDLEGKQQVKAWEIKNTIDMALQPRQTYTERLSIPFPEGATAGEIEATLTYFQRPGEESVVHKVVRQVTFR